MSYSKDGYPTEAANKVGHIKLIQDPMIQRMVECFEDVRPVDHGDLPQLTGRIEIDGAESPITQILTVDGGHQTVPNQSRPERQVGFVQVAAQLIEIGTIDYLRGNPMADPREVSRLLGRFTHHTLATLPLTGIHIPGLSIRQSLREAVHRFLNHYELYDALSYLAYRAWEPQPVELPSMDCVSCAERFELPRNAVQFTCPRCNHSHTLSDYLGLFDQDAEDRTQSETVSNFRAVLEALVLFSFVIRFQNHEAL